MDAGWSAKGQMRRELLQSDVGNIDVSQEIPNGPPQQRQAYPRMPNRMTQQQAYPNGYWPEEPERRAYSLNQKSLSSFFKHKGSRTHQGKSKGERDEDEDVMVDDSMNLMTYHDIRASANKGGERYGYGSDTAPIIPTLVTKDHNNMNNIEYRKHLTAQKKSAMSAMAKQQKGLNDGRAMSLQGFNNVNPMAAQGRMYPRYPMSQAPQGSYGNDRSNSMMHSPANFQRGPYYGPNNHGPMPGGPGRPGGPRAMSLMSSNVRPPNMRPVPNGFQAPPPHQGYGQPRGTSSEQLPVQQQAVPPQGYGQPRGTSSEQLPVQPQQQVPPVRDSARNQLNVIQLSAPQQDDWREKERLLAERERELREKERVIEEQEAQIREELRQKEEREARVPKEEHPFNQQRLPANKKDIDLDPSPTLENGLQTLSMEDRTATKKADMHNRVSTGTFVSAFSDSPEKRKLVNPTGMYQLEGKNGSKFVTAQEFPAVGQNNSSTTFDDESSLRDDTLTEISVEPVSEKRAKRSSLIRAKDFLRKLSTSSLNKDSDSQLALNKTSSRLSMNSIPNSESSHYTLMRSREPSSVQSRSRTNKSEDKLAKNLETQDDPDAFVFDNTVGKPYVPSFAKEDEIVETNKFKTITISGENLNILSENKELMNELTLVSTELAESIKRETVLEEQLKNSNESPQGENALSFADFEIELRKKSSKIVELIQQLNNERLKRFVAEEQVLLTENGAKPSSIELLNKISALEKQLELKDSEISKLKDQSH